MSSIRPDNVTWSSVSAFVAMLVVVAGGVAKVEQIGNELRDDIRRSETALLLKIAAGDERTKEELRREIREIYARRDDVAGLNGKLDAIDQKLERVVERILGREGGRQR